MITIPDQTAGFWKEYRNILPITALTAGIRSILDWRSDIKLLVTYKDVLMG